MEVFWKTIAQYNEATWIFQVIITIDEGIYGIFK